MAERVLPEWSVQNQDEAIWLDDDHAVTWTRFNSTEPNGALHWHRKQEVPGEISATPGWCVGGVSFADNGWTVESKEPLTISPSLQCLACGSHGFIRDGKWIQA